ncbi:MAG: hypothetical protein GY811_26390 [Myxococcales bacterium]|nr:hypothetical protein [Myxococcales bacterium]
MRCCSWLLMTLFLVSAFACNKPDIEDCRRGCWNYMKLTFWDKVDQEVKDMSPEQAAVIRAQREAEFQEMQERVEDPGLLNCITGCQNDASKEQIECLQEKTTAASVAACLE